MTYRFGTPTFGPPRRRPKPVPEADSPQAEFDLAAVVRLMARRATVQHPIEQVEDNS